MSRPSRAPRASWLGAITALGLTAATFAALGGTPAQATDWSACLSGPADRQAVFQRAAQRSGVPEPVLLGVSFMESRWDDHDGAPVRRPVTGRCTSPRRRASRRRRDEHAMGKGEGGVHADRPRLQATRERIGKDALSTLAKASKLTGVSERRLQRDAVANVCGGAAVLADYQREAGGAEDLGDWAASVARYSGADDQATALRFAKQVFKVIRTGEARTTNDGQRVEAASELVGDGRPAGRCAARSAASGRRSPGLPDGAGLRVAPRAVQALRQGGPATTATTTSRTGRRTGRIDYIIIHDTEAS